MQKEVIMAIKNIMKGQFSLYIGSIILPASTEHLLPAHESRRDWLDNIYIIHVHQDKMQESNDEHDV